MTRAEEYRQRAAECERQAATVRDKEARALLMCVATAWLRMAESAEQIDDHVTEAVNQT